MSRPESPPRPEAVAAFQKFLEDEDETMTTTVTATDSLHETSAADELKQQQEEEEEEEEEENDNHSKATEDGAEDEEEEEEFEFAFVSRDPDIIAADEIFLNGQIRPVYPVFGQDRDLLLLYRPGDGDRKGNNVEQCKGEGEKAIRMPLRKLMIEDDRDRIPSTSSCSSSESDELDGLPPDSYCVWTPGSVPPSPDMRKKSKSTGTSSSRRWKLRDFVIGRSHSDGKHKFMFLSNSASPPPPPAPPASEPAGKKSPGRSHSTATGDHGEKVKMKGSGRKGTPGGKASEVDVATAHRLYYARGEASAGGGELRRRSYLPYRKDLVGFFSGVNGTSRNFHPF